jgi:uncharacterized protein (TIGR02996 family)
MLRAMNEEAAFLRALIAAPDDAALRGVYADWLEERGDRRAEFLRLDADAIDPTARPRWEGLSAAYPGWAALVTTLGRPFRTGPQTHEFFPGKPESLPFTETIGRRGRIVTFESQFRDERCWDDGLTEDVRLLADLPEMECAGERTRIHPFLCEHAGRRRPATGADVLASLKARDFRSRHVATLDATSIPYPGFHPGDLQSIDNDEIHNDFSSQYLFSHGPEGQGDEFDGAHGLLKRAIFDGRLWYVLLHTTPYHYQGMLFSHRVMLFAVGLSLRGGRLLGVVTHRDPFETCDLWPG